MKPLRLLLGLCLLLPLVAHAQKNGAPAAPEPVRIRFVFLDESDGAYAVKTNETWQDLGARPYAISGPVEFFAGAKLELQKLLPDPGTGTSVRTTILSDKAPAGLTHALAVVTPVPAAADGSRNYRVRYYDVAPDKAPLRSIRILNLSPVPMAARFGDTRLELAPGDQKIATPAFDARNRVRSFVATQSGGGWKMMFNSFLSLGPDARMTGIVVYSASGMIHTYTPAELAELGKPAPGCFWLSFTDQP